jgi:hypothetical protein
MEIMAEAQHAETSCNEGNMRPADVASKAGGGTAGGHTDSVACTFEGRHCRHQDLGSLQWLCGKLIVQHLASCLCVF